MTYFHPAAVEHRRKLYTRHDAWRLAPPGTPEAKPPGWLDPSATRVRWKEAQEEEARAQEAAAQEEFERELLQLRWEVKKLKLDYELQRFQEKYSPNQPRVPAGNPDGGRWTNDDRSSGDGKVRLAAMSWDARRQMIFGQRDLLEGGSGSGNRGGAPSLPAYKRGGPSAGVLRSPGRKDMEFVSGGEGGPASRMPPGSRGFDAYTSTHVEGHAAARMRELKIQEGTLYLNHPKGPCPNCNDLLPRMLPSGARLEVVWPGGSKFFKGIEP